MQSTSRPRVLIADDDQEALELISRMIEDAGGEVVGMATDGGEAVELAKGLNPSIILMDLTMPNLDGMSALRKIRETDENVAIIVVSAHEDPRLMRESIVTGANGYLTKAQLPHHLAGSISAVLTGDFAAADPDLVRQAFDSSVRHGTVGAGGSSSDLIQTLSPREHTVLTLIAQGYDNQEIADELVISYNTVKSHITRIFEKLQVSDRTQAAVFALRSGLIDSP